MAQPDDVATPKDRAFGWLDTLDALARNEAAEHPLPGNGDRRIRTDAVDPVVGDLIGDRDERPRTAA